MIIDDWFFSHMAGWMRRRNPVYAASLAHLGSEKIIQRIQAFKLHQTVKQVYERSEFYRQVFRDNGIRPSDIKKLSDITKIPFSTSADLLKDPYAFLTVPREKVARIFTSAGTTGPPKKLLFTRKDMKSITEIGAIGLAELGVGDADTLQVMFAYGRPSWGTGTVFELGAERVGTAILASGNSLSPEEQVQLIKDSGSTMLCGTPSYLYRVTEEACKIHDLSQLGIRIIMLGAAPWPESLRSFLQQKWNAKVYDGYGLTEMGFGVAGECRMQKGLHLNELDFLFEIVDPSTGEQVASGDEGELVVTTLNREGMPLLRYRTHDLTHFLNEPCSCKVKTKRIERIKGRADDMIIVGTGENIFPNMFDQVIFGIEGVLEYQLVIEKEGFQDKITLKAEVVQKTDDVRKKLAEALHQISPIDHDMTITHTIAEPQIELSDPGTLGGISGIKVRRIIDKRRS